MKKKNWENIDILINNRYKCFQPVRVNTNKTSHINLTVNIEDLV